MVPRRSFNRNRIVFVLLLAAVVLSYPKVDKWLHTENRLERGKAYVSGMVNSVMSTPTISGIKKTYNYANTLITGSSVAAEAEANASAKAP
jgi:hypothetical protein